MSTFTPLLEEFAAQRDADGALGVLAALETSGATANAFAFRLAIAACEDSSVRSYGHGEDSNRHQDGGGGKGGGSSSFGGSNGGVSSENGSGDNSSGVSSSDADEFSAAADDAGSNASGGDPRWEDAVALYHRCAAAGLRPGVEVLLPLARVLEAAGRPAEMDAVLAAAVDAGDVALWGPATGALDLHFMNVPLSQSAVRLALADMVDAARILYGDGGGDGHGKGGSSSSSNSGNSSGSSGSSGGVSRRRVRMHDSREDMVIVTGRGRGTRGATGGGVLGPRTREFLATGVRPPLAVEAVERNEGRMVVGAAQLLQYVAARLAESGPPAAAAAAAAAARSAAARRDGRSEAECFAGAGAGASSSAALAGSGETATAAAAVAMDATAEAREAVAAVDSAAAAERGADDAGSAFVPADVAEWPGRVKLSSESETPTAERRYGQP
ncbi:unnamed protein product [Phaeothamnion confervicola]